MKQSKLMLVAVFVVIGCSSVFFTSCKKSKTVTEIDFYNNTYTPVTITVNGATSTIPVGSFVAYTGDEGSAVNVTATTANYSTSGSQIGEQVSWTISDIYPSSSNSPQQDNIDVPSTYFFLKIINQSALTIGQVYVNYGLTAQTLDNILIPNNDNVYDIGYYLAFTNSNVNLISAGGSVNWDYNISLPLTINQDYIFTAN